MGKAKSKSIRIGNEEETLKLSERQTNVNKLIERMTSKMEEPSPERNIGETGSELKRMFSFKRKVKKKKDEEGIFENNNDINLVINQNPLKNCELECCEVIDKNPTDVDEDVGNVKVTINKKDSIDNIIDLIVDKSIKRDETLNMLQDEKKVKKPLRRIKSYHGEEKERKKKTFLKMRSVDGDEEEEETLMKRLENLEKRAMIFEKEVDKYEEDERKSQKSPCSNKSEEFERNMKNAVKEASEDEEGLKGDLKTIERVKPARKDPEKDKMIAAPKADPIIRNTIGKLLHEEVSPEPSPKKPIRFIKGK